jgi:diguanylate cyclase (GGDEF)-like protein
MTISSDDLSTHPEKKNSEAEQIKCFAEFSAHLNNCRTFQALFDETVQHILQVFQADSATFYFSEKGEPLALCAGKKANGNAITVETQEVLDSISQLAQKSDALVLISGSKPEDHTKLGDVFAQQGVQSLVALPILPDTSVMITGIVLLRFYQARPQLDGEEHLLMLYAAQISRAAAHLYLAEEFRQRDLDLHAVVDTMHMMISSVEMNDLLQQIAVRLAWVSGMENCLIATYEIDPERIRILAHYNVWEASKKDNIGQEYLLANHPRLAAILWEKQPVFARQNDSDFVQARALMMEQGEYAVALMLPLKVAEQIIGFVELYSHSPDVSLPETNMRRLELLSHQVALALISARLYQSECEQRALAEAMRQLSLTLSSSLQASEILGVLLDQISNVISYDSGCVFLVEGELVRIAAQRGFESMGHILRPDFALRLEDAHNLHSMAASRKPMVISDVSLYKDWLDVGLHHILSWVGAPLIVRERLLGFISLDKAERNYYGQEHADRLGMLAGHAAVALWNAQTFGEVEQASITDFLTGTYNHRHFQQQMRTEMEYASQYHQPLSLLMLDLDHFKKVNDRYGHICGDKVLNQTANRLRSELRSVDFLARYGGEEFAILLPGTTPHALSSIGHRLLLAINSHPFEVDSYNISVTISIGGASYPEHATDVGQLISLADQSLYRAKNTGRNRFCLSGEK